MSSRFVFDVKVSFFLAFFSLLFWKCSRLWSQGCVCTAVSKRAFRLLHLLRTSVFNRNLKRGTKKNCRKTSLLRSLALTWNKWIFLFSLSHEDKFFASLENVSSSHSWSTVVRWQILSSYRGQIGIKMGTRVNIFLASCFAYGILLSSFNMLTLCFVLLGFTALYKNYKVWQFTGKFPGRNFTPDIQTFVSNSATNFHRQLNETWSTYGRDKFITWIGFERFIAVSKLNDVLVSGWFRLHPFSYPIR